MAESQLRVRKALERAAEILKGFEQLGPDLGPSDEAAQEYVVGWVKAIQALIAIRAARLATGWQSSCVKQVHGDLHIKCGECFICLERTAINAFIADMLEEGA